MSSRTRRSPCTAPFWLACLVLIALAACQQAEPLEVTYYYLPG